MYSDNYKLHIFGTNVFYCRLFTIHMSLVSIEVTRCLYLRFVTYKVSFLSYSLGRKVFGRFSLHVARNLYSKF